MNNIHMDICFKKAGKQIIREKEEEGNKEKEYRKKKHS